METLVEIVSSERGKYTRKTDDWIKDKETEKQIFDSKNKEFEGNVTKEVFSFFKLWNLIARLSDMSTISADYLCNRHLNYEIP